MDPTTTPAPGDHPTAHSDTFGLGPWPARLAAALARHRIGRDVRRMAPHLAYDGPDTDPRQLTRLFLRWHSPSGDDNGRLDAIAAHAVKQAADRGLVATADVDLRLTTHKATAENARIEVYLYAAHPPGAGR
ncbi:hypothetical protein [Nocardia sp. NPDC003963]